MPNRFSHNKGGNKRTLRYIKVVSQRRARIFANYLKINFEKPFTIFLAMFFPFMQAFLASCINILTNKDNELITNILLFTTSALYYIAFIANTKRATKGSWVGLAMLVIFGSLGLVCGKLFVLYLR
jgi:hypothetical protein